MKRTLIALVCLALSAGVTLPSDTAEGEFDRAEATEPGLAPDIQHDSAARASSYDDGEPVIRNLERIANRRTVPARSLPAAFSVPEFRPLQMGEVAGRPLAIAAADFDGDGVADLVCGYTGASGSFVTMHRGNVDAILPNTVAAREREAAGTFSDLPFFSPTVFEASHRPDFLGVGDFDNDGNQDVVFGASGGWSLRLMPGDGTGGLRAGEIVALPGALTALVAGEINRPDGLVDLVAAVAGPDGASALVFEGPQGALRHEPEVLSLPAQATALVLARVSGHAAIDLLVGMEHELQFVRGRDRRLSVGAEQQEQVQPATVERMELGGTIRAVATGEFNPETDGPEIAVLFDDGSLSVLGRETPAERISAGWTVKQQLEVADSPVAHGALHPVRLSGSFTQELLVLDKTGQRLVVLKEGTSIGSADLEARPMAVLPMRLDQDALTDLVLIDRSGVPSTSGSAPLASIVVTTGADTAIAGDGFCSLREAIHNANSDSDITAGDCTGGGGADAIDFNVGGGGSAVAIALTSALPVILDTVTIDGNTQGCATPPCVGLYGSAAGVGARGLVLAGGASTVRGLLIRDFDTDGISLESPGNLVESNFIGTDVTGTTAAGNTVGIFVMEADNVIGGTAPGAGNLVSGNGDGIVVMGPSATLNVVLGNRVGTDVTGSLALGNLQWGILIFDAPANVVGSTIAAARNVVSGNGGAGIRIEQPQAIGNFVQGNFVGVNAAGTAAVPNAFAGIPILFDASDNMIGGVAVGAGNVISGNTTFGVALVWGATANHVQGNLIGTDHTGTVALPNLNSGVIVEEATGNTVGGPFEQVGNLISGNAESGVYLLNLTSPGNHVDNNLIGTDVTGTSALGNGFNGIEIENASGNAIGEIDSDRSNVISGNLLDGILISGAASTSNSLHGNLIGTDVMGTVALPNLDDGVHISAGSGNLVGGDVAFAGNLVSGNGDRGVVLTDAASGNEIGGNLIGTDITLSAPLGNGNDGVLIQDSDGNTVGGPPVAGNIIFGNTFNGVWLLNSDGNQLLGNLIGTNLANSGGLGNGANGVSISGGSLNNVVGGTAEGAGNLISGNAWSGVIIGEVLTSGNQVLGNLIGTDSSGTAALGNLLRGVFIWDGASGNLIGGATPEARNVIAANGTFGVSIVGSSANEVLGNYVGVDASGTVPMGNGNSGVIVQDSPDNLIGGAGAGNLISGNGNLGVYVLNPASTGNRVLGNKIGTDASGTVALGNGPNHSGVRILSAASNSIGGDLPGEGNLISGNTARGVNIGADADFNEVLGNFIGTDVAGMAALGNVTSAVFIQDSSNNIIGGTAEGAGNLISGGGEDGVVVIGTLSSGNEILGNLIGTDLTGAPTLGNNGAGVGFVDTRGNSIGGTIPGAANVIAGNADEGVAILGTPANRNPILGNSIFANGLIGIDLNWPDSVTSNDVGDGDTGPNNLQNFPSLTLAQATPANVTIEGGLNSVATSDFRIEFFTSTICDATGYGEGERFLGHTDVFTNVSGNASFSVTLPVPVSNGDSIATTATDVSGNTSEFCGCVTVNCVATAVFGVTMVAQDQNSWIWGGPADIRYAKGDLAGVSGYTTTVDGTLFAADSLDMSMDLPAPGDGLYYMVRPLGCGSWETAPGAEPGRDTALP